ncbi:MAG: hypothetical protein BGP12_21715 [Rhodospirillales bacterium 70-18]|nr:MAG: hypothetical protein BGP12_21715 [Rhodospirillales bacterium 70-18]
MQNPLWHPSDEAMAASNIAAFIEWLRAGGRHSPAGPAGVAAWAQAEPAAFARAISDFAGLDPALGYAENLARAATGRVVLLRPAGRREIAAAALSGPGLPARIAAMLKAGCSGMLPAQAADHLLWFDLRPDERLLWAGGLIDPWPLGALLAGATLILCDPAPADPQAAAAREGARLLRRPAAGPATR